MIEAAINKATDNFIKILENGIQKPTLWRAYNSSMDTTCKNCQLSMTTSIGEYIHPEELENKLRFSLRIGEDSFLIECQRGEVFKEKEINKEKVREFSKKLFKLAYDNIFNLTKEENKL